MMMAGRQGRSTRERVPVRYQTTLSMEQVVVVVVGRTDL